MAKGQDKPKKNVKKPKGTGAKVKPGAAPPDPKKGK